jgi:predicted CXXCH cytochrome family protein
MYKCIRSFSKVLLRVLYPIIGSFSVSKHTIVKYRRTPALADDAKNIYSKRHIFANKRQTLLSLGIKLLAIFIYLNLDNCVAQVKVLDTKGKDCQSAGCHDNIGKKKNVHGPTATGDCAECHKEVEEHKFKLSARDSALCYNCHDPLPTAKHTHDPVAQGDCVACHDPHESDNSYMLIQPNGAKLCFECHDEKIAEHSFPHEPVKKGDCLGCHDVHYSANSRLLKAPGSALCFKCHEDIQERLEKSKHIHSPVEDGCDECHRPHGSAVESLLKSKSPGVSTLCLECHEEIADSMKSSVKHAPMTKDKECSNCHDPHASNFHPILKKAPMHLCLSCHDRTYNKDGVVITNIAKLLDENPDHHGPIQKKDCSKCHSSHGSDTFRLLKGSYPSKFYAPFSFENFGLCFDCHEKDTFLTEQTKKLTEFRNGEQNLHFLHVNREEKGRTCRTCHETHASQAPKHIRSKVPFGKWELPIKFKKTNSGGSCLPGCHKLKQYDRERPVKYIESNK